MIPTRNRWELLSKNALPSALAQVDVDFEVVIVDDGGDDATARRLAQLESEEERVRVVRHATPRRLPGARNSGAAAARGRWLAFLDDDDIWSPRKLRSQLDAAAGAGASWAYGGAIVVDGDARPIGVDPLPDPRLLASLLDGGNWIPGGGSNVILTAELFRDVGGFDEELRFFEDWDLWLRLIRVAPPAACDGLLMARVEHGANMVVRDREEVMPALERMLSKWRRVERDDRLSVAQWLAWEQHRAGLRRRAARAYLDAAVRYRSIGNLPPALGALAGEPGMRAASRLLRGLTGASHLEPAAAATPREPSWLREHRERIYGTTAAFK